MALLRWWFLVLFLLAMLNGCQAPSSYIPSELINQDRDEIIRQYFNLGFSYNEILAFLLIYHGICIGMRQLHRILRAMGLRRNNCANTNAVINRIMYEIAGSGRDLGYRSMQARLRLSGINVDRESVRIILAALDPEGVASRRHRRLRRREYVTKGPNYLYHVDGWDKLKRYGLCVHGCIDGFSRRILWLKASSTNNDPFVVCKYYVENSLLLNGIPCIVRADRGTENVCMELMQTLLRSENGDQRGLLQSTFLYGRSTSNQRIEAWWSKFCMFGMRTWIDHFKEMEEFGVIDVSLSLVRECIRFCYLDLLRKELDIIRIKWNTHSIRPSTNDLSPSGKPDVMFHFPEVYHTASYLKELDQQSLHVLDAMLTRGETDCVPIYKNIFESVVEEKHLSSSPETLNEAADLLVLILDTVEEEMEQL